MNQETIKKFYVQVPYFDYEKKFNRYYNYTVECKTKEEAIKETDVTVRIFSCKESVEEIKRKIKEYK